MVCVPRLVRDANHGARATTSHGPPSALGLDAMAAARAAPTHARPGVTRIPRHGNKSAPFRRAMAVDPAAILNRDSAAIQTPALISACYGMPQVPSVRYERAPARPRALRPCCPPRLVLIRLVCSLVQAGSSAASRSPIQPHDRKPVHLRQSSLFRPRALCESVPNSYPDGY